jgi:hypothetical protein
MTAMFHDIKTDRDLEQSLADNRIIGSLFDEVLYADDTIIFSENAKMRGDFMRKIELEGEKYGLKNSTRISVS